MAKSPASILAETFGWDASEAREHRYQDTRTPFPIFCIGDKYYAVRKTKPTWDGLDWRELGDQFWAQRSNTIVWVAAMNSEAE